MNQAFVKVDIQVIDCLKENVNPISTFVDISFNATDLTVLLTEVQVAALFTASVDARCKVSDWFLSTNSSTDKVLSGDIFDVFAQLARSGGLEPLKFDPTKNIKKNWYFEARLWAYIGST